MSDLAKTLDTASPELEEARRVNRTLQRQLVKSKAMTEDIIAAVYQAVRDAHAIAGPAPRVVRPKPDRRAKQEESCLIHTTDWQVGKITDSYNSDVAKTRLVDQFCSKIALLTDIQRAAHPVRRADIMFGGDMIEGIGIFPGQAFGIDSTLFEQLFNVVNIEEAQIRFLLALFDVVHVWVEKGNHGRYGKKGEAPSGDNFDLMSYEICKQRFSSERRVVWHDLISPKVWNLVEVGAYRALLFHGDEIKSYGGNLPSYGIVKKINAWASGVAPAFTDAYGGHFHTRMTLPMSNGGSIFMTGSPESDNEYATEFVAAKGMPSQRVHFVDLNRGRVTAEYVTYFED